MATARDDDEKPERQAHKRLVDLLQVQLRFQIIMREGTALLCHLPLLFAKAHTHCLRTRGKKQEYEEGTEDGKNSLDEENPAPGTPTMVPIKVFGDAVSDKPIEGAGKSRHGIENGLSGGKLAVGIEER